jgi:hypothetical protein
MLEDAATDLKTLLDRGYRRDSALKFVGDHYLLTKGERNRLLREIYSEAEIRHAASKLHPISAIRDQPVAVDGFNVLITVEAGLAGGEVFMCQDGFMRDNVMAFGNYRIGKSTMDAADRVLEVLGEHKPKHVTWIFDSQISGSGRLAEYVRKACVDAGLSEGCTTCPTADARIVKMNLLTATSDTALIRRLHAVFDLPAAVIDL